MVYDCFTFFNELDLLEIRLEELDSVVDKFVLVEADRTFQNTKKSFIFEENKERFSKFLDKIIHVKITKYPLFIPLINPFSPWKLEFYQRNAILKGLVNCKPDDIVMFSDIDEIPNHKVIKDRIQHGVQKIYGLKMHLYLYFLNNQLVFDGTSNMTEDESKDGIWYCTALLPYKLLKKKPHRIRKIIMRTKRRGEVFEIIPNAGWHFSYMGGAKNIIKKIESYSHTEFNNEKFKNEEKIKELITSGEDLFGRDMKFKTIEATDNFPSFLQTAEAKSKFKDLFI